MTQPPNLSYLTRTLSSTVDNNGNAAITFRPDTGQYWLPTLVHVGTRSGNNIRCALHAGGIAALSDNTTTKDLTFQGSNDTSSILSGIVVSPGEGIRCVFDIGTPGDTVFAEIAGLSSVAPPTMGIVPDIPGVRFTGSSLLGLQRTIANQVTSGILPPGIGAFLGSNIDMRGYQSFGFAFDSLTVANATVNTPIQILFQWTDDSPFLSRVLYEQHWEIFAGDSNPATLLTPTNSFNGFGRFEVQDIVHGSFLQIALLFNPILVDSLTLTWTIFGSQIEKSGGAYVRNTPSNTSGLLLGGYHWNDSYWTVSAGALAAGANTNFYLPMTPGPASIFLQSSAATASTTWFTPTGKVFSADALAGGGAVAIVNKIFPMTAIRLNVQNTGAVPSTITVSAVIDRQVVG